MTREEIAAVVREQIHAVIEGMEGQEIGDADSMKDFGADSLEIVEVVSRSMKQLRIKVRRTELNKAENFGGLLDILTAARRKQHG